MMKMYDNPIQQEAEELMGTVLDESFLPLQRDPLSFRVVKMHDRRWVDRWLAGVETTLVYETARGGGYSASYECMIGMKQRVEAVYGPVHGLRELMRMRWKASHGMKPMIGECRPRIASYAFPVEDDERGDALMHRVPADFVRELVGTLEAIEETNGEA